MHLPFIAGCYIVSIKKKMLFIVNAKFSNIDVLTVGISGEKALSDISQASNDT